MADNNSVSIKVREADYDAAKQVTADLPLSLIDVFTAMRILWESANEKQRMEAIRKVRQESEVVA